MGLTNDCLMGTQLVACFFLFEWAPLIMHARRWSSNCADVDGREHFSLHSCLQILEPSQYNYSLESITKWWMVLFDLSHVYHEMLYSMAMQKTQITPRIKVARAGSRSDFDCIKPAHYCSHSTLNLSFYWERCETNQPTFSKGNSLKMNFSFAPCVLCVLGNIGISSMSPLLFLLQNPRPTLSLLVLFLLLGWPLSLRNVNLSLSNAKSHNLFL